VRVQPRARMQTQTLAHVHTPTHKHTKNSHARTHTRTHTDIHQLACAYAHIMHSPKYYRSVHWGQVQAVTQIPRANSQLVEIRFCLQNPLDVFFAEDVQQCQNSLLWKSPQAGAHLSVHASVWVSMRPCTMCVWVECTTVRETRKESAHAHVCSCLCILT